MKALLPLLFVLSIGCASVPVIPAITQTDTLLDSGILSPAHVVTVAEKKQIKAILTADKAEIKKEQKAAVSNAFWSKWGKIGAGILFLFIILAGIKKALF